MAVNPTEYSEIFQIEREEAIKKVVRILRDFDIGIEEIAELYPDVLNAKLVAAGSSTAKLFDPFFDVR